MEKAIEVEDLKRSPNDTKVPTESMPPVAHAFVENQPVTSIVVNKNIK